jgi:hypothetical protein
VLWSEESAVIQCPEFGANRMAYLHVVHPDFTFTNPSLLGLVLEPLPMAQRAYSVDQTGAVLTSPYRRPGPYVFGVGGFCMFHVIEL